MSRGFGGAFNLSSFSGFDGAVVFNEMSPLLPVVNATKGVRTFDEAERNVEGGFNVIPS